MKEKRGGGVGIKPWKGGWRDWSVAATALEDKCLPPPLFYNYLDQCHPVLLRGPFFFHTCLALRFFLSDRPPPPFEVHSFSIHSSPSLCSLFFILSFRCLLFFLIPLATIFQLIPKVMNAHSLDRRGPWTDLTVKTAVTAWRSSGTGDLRQRILRMFLDKRTSTRKSEWTRER